MIQLEAIAHLKAPWIEPLRGNQNLEMITPVHRPQEVGAAVHHWQCDLRPLLLAAAARKDLTSFSAVTLQALLPGFMAPAQQLMEMHHAGCIGVAEAHRSRQC